MYEQIHAENLHKYACRWECSAVQVAKRMNMIQFLSK